MLDNNEISKTMNAEIKLAQLPTSFGLDVWGLISKLIGTFPSINIKKLINWDYLSEVAKQSTNPFDDIILLWIRARLGV